MKRDILCPACAAEHRKLHGVPEKSQQPHRVYNTEFVKFVDGTALSEFMDNGCFHCDSCYETIREGEPCVAASVWTTRIPYYPWETAYIKPDTRG